MGIFKAENNATSTLAGALNAGTLTLTVQTGHGDRFPEITGTDFTYLFLEDSLLNQEIIKVTARTSGADSMTIERAQLGTSARSWLSGDLVECRPEASQYQDHVNHLAATSGAHNASAIATTPAGNLAATNVQASLAELDDEKLGKAAGGTVSGNVDFTGNVTFDGGAGAAGQVLVSQGTGATPAFGSSPSEMGTTGTGTGNLFVYNNVTGALELADLATQTNLVDYRVANTAGTEYEIGSGSITYTNTGGVTWTENFGVLDGQDIKGTAYGAGVRVIVGGSGKVLTSTDDVTWTARDGGFGSTTINAVIYAGSKFVAVGGSGKLSTSSDGITWVLNSSAATAMSSQSINAIAHNGTYYVIGGGLGLVATAADATSTWTANASATVANGANTVRAMACGGGYTICAGSVASAKCADPPTGAWAAVTEGFAGDTVYGLAYGNVSGTTPTFVAVGSTGKITYSTHATFTTWNSATPNFGTSTINAVTFAGGYFVAVADSGKIGYDADGQSGWTAVTPLSTTQLLCVGYGNSAFVAGGANAVRITSSNGTTWSPTGNKMVGEIAYAAAYGNSTYLIAGATGKLSTSTDAVTWTERTSGITTTDIKAALYAGSKWVICGASDKAATSSDGAAWSAYSGTLGGSSNANALTYGNSVYVMVGDGAKLYTSATALSASWTSRTSGFTADNIYGVAYALIGATHTFVAVGAGGKIASSVDGSAVTWTLRTSPSASDMNAVAYGSGRFVASGVGGLFRYSSDGTTWYTAPDCTAGAAYTINSITYANGLFVAVSQSSKILTSPDGISWTLQTTTAFNYAYYAVCGNATEYLAAGARGASHTSPVGIAALSLARSAQYITSNANGLVNFSAGTKNVGISPRSVAVLTAPIADFTLTSGSGVQTAFPTTGDILTVLAMTAYEFEGQYIVNTGATSHTTALAFLLAAGATVSSFEYVVDCISAAASTPAATQTTHVTGVASTVVNAASTAVYTIIKFRGIARFTLGGTVKPQINFSADPTGTNLMKVGSYVKFTPIGSRDVAVIGQWA